MITQEQLFDEYCAWVAGLETPTQAEQLRMVFRDDNRLDGYNRLLLNNMIDEQLNNIAAINNNHEINAMDHLLNITNYLS